MSIIGAIAIIWSAVSYFLSEKYMDWYYHQFSKDCKAYDAKIFRITHSSTLFAIGALAVVIKLTDYNHDWISLTMMCAVLFVHYLVIFKLAEKDRQ